MKVLEIAKFKKLEEGMFELIEVAGENYFDEYDDCGIIFFSKEEIEDFLFQEFPEDNFILEEVM